MKHIEAKGAQVVIYGASLEGSTIFFGRPVDNNIIKFKELSHVTANCYDTDFDDVAAKVYTRDIFRRD